MAVTVIVGAQWGDEGKGKVVDLLSKSADVVARWGGGPNAGHTVVVGSEKYILHHIPSGILNPNTLCLLGAGVVIDPWKFLEEVDALQLRGIAVEKRLVIDGRAHTILPYHRSLDKAQERSNAIGTTGRGIGPCYTDKSSRHGIRLADFLDEAHLRERLQCELDAHNEVLVKLFGDEPLNVKTVIEETVEIAKRMRPFVGDVSLLLEQNLAGQKQILLEGAQGALLDINFGTYPYVTSSEPIAGGAASGLGIGPRHLQHVIGIAKAYVTRVGNGPFPTEIEGEMGIDLRKRGNEFGSTTGRARRCGWWDNVVAKYTVRVNGLTGWALTKLDVLTGIDPIPVCVAYESPKGRIEHFPMTVDELKECKPVLEYLPGWKEDITGVTEMDKLPANAKKYIEAIEKMTGVPVVYISVGERREQTIKRH